MTTYHVIVTREGGAWLGDVPSLEGTHTWARTLAALDRDVREAIVLAVGLPDDAVGTLELTYDYRTGDDDLDSATAQLRAARRERARIEAEVTERTAQLVARLVSSYSVRDTAAMVGISPQRVSQLGGIAG